MAASSVACTEDVTFEQMHVYFLSVCAYAVCVCIGNSFVPINDKPKNSDQRRHGRNAEKCLSLLDERTNAKKLFDLRMTFHPKANRFFRTTHRGKNVESAGTRTS